MIELALRNYAHIGDAVWELYVREYTVFKTQNAKKLHNYTTELVRASFQAELLSRISDEFYDVEKDIARRARNTSIPIARRNNQQEYRASTAFEALIGYWYLTDKERLNYFLTKFKAMDEFTL